MGEISDTVQMEYSEIKIIGTKMCRPDESIPRHLFFRTKPAISFAQCLHCPSTNKYKEQCISKFVTLSDGADYGQIFL